MVEEAVNALAHAVAPMAQAGPTVALGFRFYSPAGGLEAAGCLETIDQPAGDAGEALGAALQDAFGRARAAGLDNPTAVGVIPFDKTQPSRLFIPEHLVRLPPSPAPTAVCGLPCGQPRSCQAQPDRAGFEAGVRQALEHLQRGTLSKTVLARLLRLEFERAPCVPTLFQRLRRQNPEAYHFCVGLPEGGVLVGASPELLLRKDGRQVLTHPLAGSARRQRDVDADDAAADRLLASAKDRHEHRLVIEQIRRQLAPLCERLVIPAQPSLFATSKLWHLATRIEGQLQAEQSALTLACRLHPTPALCGFPTDVAKRLIGELEPFDRGVFGGIVGWCDAAGNGEWAVAIRCGVIERRQVRLFAGAGVVSASSPEQEWQETTTKLGTMLAAFGLEGGAA
jgi:isochorismate synthase